MRRVIAALIVAALAVAVVLLWPRTGGDDGDDTIAGGTTTSTSNTSTTTTTPTMPTTNTTFDDTRVVETVEEAEAVLRELWFGWFEGIYLQDEDRIREVVATEEFLRAGVEAFGTLAFIAPPAPDAIAFETVEILHSSEECLAVWSAIDPSFLELDEPRTGVEVLRWLEGGWRFATAWRERNDLWEPDCEAELSPLP